MIITFFFTLILLSYLSNYYLKKKITNKIEIINYDYILLFDNIISIINYYINEKIDFINYTNNKLINNYAILYGFNIKSNISNISNNCIIFIDKYFTINLNLIFEKHNNIIVISTFQIKNLNTSLNFHINKYYIYH